MISFRVLERAGPTASRAQRRHVLIMRDLSAQAIGKPRASCWNLLFREVLRLDGGARAQKAIAASKEAPCPEFPSLFNTRRKSQSRALSKNRRQNALHYVAPTFGCEPDQCAVLAGKSAAKHASSCGRWRWREESTAPRIAVAIAFEALFRGRGSGRIALLAKVAIAFKTLFRGQDLRVGL
ncbi:MAG: hypothetical protein C4334_07385 [Pyrinomonas sp.]